MAKYTDRLAGKLITLIEGDLYSIKEICDLFNISTKTFYEWKKEKPEFGQAIEDAIDRRDERLAAKARRALESKMEGYLIVEEKFVYVPAKHDPAQLVLKSKTVKKKMCPPDTATIKLILERDDKRKEKKGSKEKNLPFVIEVVNDEQKEALELLRHNLMNNGSPERHVHHQAQSNSCQKE